MPAHAGSDTTGPSDPPPTILIVDDRKENLLALEAVLEPLDVPVVRASSGPQAVELCRRQEFAVVVLDVMMPGADGLETARRLKEVGASRLTPIVFLTAAESDRRRIHAGYATGAVDYLFKPVDPDVLRAKVAAFVELYRNRHAEHWLQRRRYADQTAAATAAAHREGEQRFRLLAESVPAMVWTATADGRMDSMNAFGARYVGALTDSVNDIRWTDHVHPDDVARARREWMHAVRSASPFETEVRIWSAEGRAFRRHIARAAPRRDAASTVLGWVGVNADVEESKLAEEAAHELQLTAERRARLASDDARDELARALDRIARLQALTAALSEAAAPVDVARAVVVHGVAALDASAVVLAMLERSEAGTPEHLRVVATHGYPQRVTDPWRIVPLDADIPLAKAARTGDPVFIGDAASRLKDFPELERVEPQYASAYAMPLRVQGEVIGVLGLSFPTATTLSDEDRTFADAIARQCAQALHRADLFAAERRAHQEAEVARRRVEFLSEAGAVLAESLEYQQTLQALVELAVPFLGDYALVDMIAPDGTLQRLALMHRDPEKRALLAESVTHIAHIPDAGHPTHGGILDGTSRIFSPCDDDVVARIAFNPRHRELLRALGITSLISVPLRARNRTRGVMVFGRTTPGASHSAADLQLAEDLVRRASVAIDTAILYEQAQEANQAKASFLAAISHDLRQPLNASLGFLEIALMGIRGEVTPGLREDLERVRRNQQHLLALINDVLSFARVEAGQLIVRRDIVPLRDVLEGLPALVSPQADAKGIRLSIGSCAPDVHIIGDRDRIVQVFTNLLTNAIKATPRGGFVSVECESGGDVVLGHVRDTGVGIPDEMRDRIFEPFVQVARSLNKPEEGIGLGLSISRNLARAMGGDLTVTSTLGAGSVFTLRLPTAAATPALGIAAVPG